MLFELLIDLEDRVRKGVRPPRTAQRFTRDQRADTGKVWIRFDKEAILLQRAQNELKLISQCFHGGNTTIESQTVLFYFSL